MSVVPPADPLDELRADELRAFERPGARLPDEPQDLSQRGHRRMIGSLGLGLPGLLYLLAGARPTAGLAPWQRLDSISAYYYSGAGALFVGVIFALSLFLFSYRGYQGVWADRIVGAVAGGAAIVVALCPTGAPAVALRPEWWDPWVGRAHLIAAIVLFGSFILFSVWLFRKSDTPKERRPRDKHLRNHFFLACGVVMAVAVIVAIRNELSGRPIFFEEAVAVEAFALSWLVKGEAHLPVVALLSRRASAR